jgi:hypothetical protein
MTPLDLTPEQEAHAHIVAEKVLQIAREKILEMTRLAASQPDNQVLGQTEFQLRDLVHAIAAAVIEAEVQERPKKVTRAPA